jgi:hypothetical protein
MKTIPEPAAEAVRRHFGRDLEFWFAGWPHGQSLMWKAAGDGGPALYVKVHAEPYLYERHVAAFRDWVPQLPCSTPEVLFEDQEHLLMVFAELDGVPLETASVSRETELEAYRVAGRVAKAFHHIELNESEEAWSAANAARNRMERYIAMSDGKLCPELLAWTKTVLPETELFRGERRVPCHRDYSPRNWLVSETNGQLQWSLIDFERARLDLKYADFQRMWPDAWKGRPDRRTAFFEGYGLDLSADEEKRLRITVLTNCLGTIPWAVSNNDPAFGQWALDTLTELRDQW